MSATEEDNTEVGIAISLTGEVQSNEDGTFIIADEDGMFEAVLQAEFLENGNLQLRVDDTQDLEMISVGAESVVKIITEQSGFHLKTE